MKQSDFIRRCENDWKWMEATLSMNSRAFHKRAGDFPRIYRRIIRDLNTARSEDFDPGLVEHLNSLILRGHNRMRVTRNGGFKKLADFITSDFPRAVRSEWKLLTSFVLLFMISSVAAAFLIVSEPSRMSSWFTPDAADSLAEMFNPEASHFLTPRGVEGDADMFGFYIYNNISIAFQTFASGLLAGLGSAIFFFYNAVFLGAATGYLITRGFEEPFFTFIAGHSTIELSSLIFAAAAGWRLGTVLIRPPGRLGRLEGLLIMGRRMTPLIYGSALLLVIAASIEAFWSPQILPAALKYTAGLVTGLLFLSYLIFAGRHRDT